MFTKKFHAETLERALKSAAQAAVLAFGAGTTNILEVPGMLVLGAAGAGFVLSVLTSVASYPIGESKSASLVETHECNNDCDHHVCDELCDHPPLPQG